MALRSALFLRCRLREIYHNAQKTYRRGEDGSQLHVNSTSTSKTADHSNGCGRQCLLYLDVIKVCSKLLRAVCWFSRRPDSSPAVDHVRSARWKCTAHTMLAPFSEHHLAVSVCASVNRDVDRRSRGSRAHGHTIPDAYAASTPRAGRRRTVPQPAPPLTPAAQRAGWPGIRTR